MSRSSLLPSFALATLIVGGCRSSSFDATTCGETQYAGQAVADTGWRARVESQFAASPSDSILGVVFFFASQVTDADLADLTARGVSIGYLFRGFPGASGSTRVANMRSIATSDTTSRIVNVAFGQPLSLLSCH